MARASGSVSITVLCTDCDHGRPRPDTVATLVLRTEHTGEESAVYAFFVSSSSWSARMPVTTERG
jgi:hypothetical protein